MCQAVGLPGGAVPAQHVTAVHLTAVQHHAAVRAVSHMTRVCRQFDASSCTWFPTGMREDLPGKQAPSAARAPPLHAQVMFMQHTCLNFKAAKWILQQNQGLHPSGSRAPPVPVDAATDAAVFLINGSMHSHSPADAATAASAGASTGAGASEAGTGTSSSPGSTGALTPSSVVPVLAVPGAAGA